MLSDNDWLNHDYGVETEVTITTSDYEPTIPIRDISSVWTHSYMYPISEKTTRIIVTNTADAVELKFTSYSQNTIYTKFEISKDATNVFYFCNKVLKKTIFAGKHQRPFGLMISNNGLSKNGDYVRLMKVNSGQYGDKRAHFIIYSAKDVLKPTKKVEKSMTLFETRIQNDLPSLQILARENIRACNFPLLEIEKLPEILKEFILERKNITSLRFIIPAREFPIIRKTMCMSCLIHYKRVEIKTVEIRYVYPETGRANI